MPACQALGTIADRDIADSSLSSEYHTTKHPRQSIPFLVSLAFSIQQLLSTINSNMLVRWIVLSSHLEYESMMWTIAATPIPNEDTNNYQQHPS